MIIKSNHHNLEEERVLFLFCFAGLVFVLLCSFVVSEPAKTRERLGRKRTTTKSLFTAVNS